jgi:hypothetical protein
LDALTVDVRALLVTGSAPSPTAAGGPARVPGRSAAVTARAPAGEESIPESPDLVGSWVSYQRLTEAGIGLASLDTLLAASSRDTARPVPPPPAAKAAPELAVVDVRSLLYRGDSALARARELRATARLVSGDALRALVEEVCDLVALAIEPGPPFPAPATSARAGS